MPNLGNTTRPAYVYDAETDTWCPIGVGAHTHSNYLTASDLPGSTITVESGSTVPLTIQNNGTGNSFVVNDAVSDTTSFVISENGNVGIGTVPFSTFKIHSYDASVNNTWLEGDGNVTLNVQRSSTDTSASAINFRKSRGTAASKTATSTNDGVGLIQFFGHDGTNAVNTAIISSVVDDTVSTGIVPGRISFQTANSSGTLAARMTIKSSGNVGIGTTTPGYPLDVNGTINATALYVGGSPLSVGGMTQILTGSFSGNSVSITSIPSGYKDIVVIARNISMSANDQIRLRINGDTSTLYHGVTMGSVSTTNMGQSAGNMLDLSRASTMALAGPHNYNLTITEYASTSRFKNMKIHGSYGASGSMFLSGLYASNSAVTSVQFLFLTGTTFTGGTYTVYGVN